DRESQARDGRSRTRAGAWAVLRDRGRRFWRERGSELRTDAEEVASELGIEIEERIHARPQLLLDVFLTTLEHVHGDMGGLAILQLEAGVLDLRYFLGGQQAHSIDEGESGHCGIVRRRQSRVVDLRRTLAMPLLQSQSMRTTLLLILLHSSAMV